MRVVITTDLDRTLLFSRRAIEKLGGALPATVVDPANGREVTIAHDVRDALAALESLATVVPVTTRTPDRLDRIQPPFPGRYAIASNGAVVLIDGVPDAEWVATNRLPRHDLSLAVAILDRLGDASLLNRHYEPSGAFACAVTPTAKAATALAASLAAECAEIGWQAVATGHKVYVQPAELDKVHATTYVLDRIAAEGTGELVHLAAGDSLLDLSMLGLADLAWIPQGSELDRAGHGSAHRVTTEPGHRAAREITTSWLRIARGDEHVTPSRRALPRT